MRRHRIVKIAEDKAQLQEAKVQDDVIVGWVEEMDIPMPGSSGGGGSSEEISELREEVDGLRGKIERQERTNRDGVINTDKEVHDFLEGYNENEKLQDKIGDNMTDEDILDTFGYKPGDVDFDDL